jgi:hypothetical protein
MKVKLQLSEMHHAEVCLSWRQRVRASDHHIRLHRLDAEKSECRLKKMSARANFRSEAEAQKAIQQPTTQLAKRPLSFTEYQRCKHCWDGLVIVI